MLPTSKALTLAVSIALLATGCQQPPAAPTTRPALKIVSTAPTNDLELCVEHMHNLCDALLRHYVMRRDLPKQLSDLKKIAPDLALTCPACKKPYVYDPAGAVVPGIPGPILVYDAESAHSGTWVGIMAEPSDPGQPMVLHVVRLPLGKHPN